MKCFLDRYLKLSRNDQSGTPPLEQRPIVTNAQVHAIEFGDITHSDTDRCDTWTSVELRLREDCKGPLSNRADLARFLVSSITFLETVDTITVTFAGKPVLRIRKELEYGLRADVDIPPVKDNSRTMTIASIKSASTSFTLTFRSFLRFFVQHRLSQSILRGSSFRKRSYVPVKRLLLSRIRCFLLRRQSGSCPLHQKKRANIRLLTISTLHK